MHPTDRRLHKLLYLLANKILDVKYNHFIHKAHAIREYKNLELFRLRALDGTVMETGGAERLTSARKRSRCWASRNIGALSP